MNIKLEELDKTDDYLSYCQLLKHLTSINIDNISQEMFLKHLLIIQENPFHKIIVAKINDKIIGSITILVEPKFIHDLSYVAHIEDVIVDPLFRSHGIGKKLINYAIEVATKYKCYKVILDCCQDNINFYKKNGFDVKETQMVLYFGK